MIINHWSPPAISNHCRQEAIKICTQSIHTVYCINICIPNFLDYDIESAFIGSLDLVTSFQTVSKCVSCFKKLIFISANRRALYYWFFIVILKCAFEYEGNVLLNLEWFSCFHLYRKWGVVWLKLLNEGKNFTAFSSYPTQRTMTLGNSGIRIARAVF